VTVAASAEPGRPPGPPWRALTDAGRGYLSVYYSDPIARYPVRELTRRLDNKCDPNIETLTFGLFSTCEPHMRNRIVADGAATLFFVTKHRGRPRAVTGYYKIGWYTEGVRGAENRDWALAASSARFVDPIPVALVVEKVPACGGWFRTQKRLDPAATTTLKRLIDRRADRTDGYLRELARVERFASARTGYAYPSWGRQIGFSWNDAPAFLRKTQDAVDAPNTSPTGRWACTRCRMVIPNAALLKQCPACQAMGTLVPDI
jgi:hypothetical protein